MISRPPQRLDASQACLLVAGIVLGAMCGGTGSVNAQVSPSEARHLDEDQRRADRLRVDNDRLYWEQFKRDQEDAYAKSQRQRWHDEEQARAAAAKQAPLDTSGPPSHAPTAGQGEAHRTDPDTPDRSPFWGSLLIRWGLFGAGSVLCACGGLILWKRHADKKGVVRFAIATALAVTVGAVSTAVGGSLLAKFIGWSVAVGVLLAGAAVLNVYKLLGDIRRRPRELLAPALGCLLGLVLLATGVATKHWDYEADRGQAGPEGGRPPGRGRAGTVRRRPPESGGHPHYPGGGAEAR